MKLQKQFRSLGSPEVKVIDKEARTMEFPFSSELPVDRYFGTEILSHKDGAFDLNRLNDGHPLLWNHDPSQVIGVVERAELRSDKRLWATVRFSQNLKAQEVLKDIEDGILRNVSFGYQIEEMMLTKAGKGGPDEYTATKWMPFEVSVVSIPADPTVGIGRSKEDEALEVKILNLEDKPKGEFRVMELTAEQKALAEAKLVADATQNERIRSTSIQALGEKFEKKDLARQLVEGGKSIEEARAIFLEAIGAKQVALTGTEGEVGLSSKEKKNYSWVRALNFLANPNDMTARKAAAFELEVSLAAADRAGKSSRGLMIPVDMLRDLTVGVAADGGNLVGTQLQSQSFIDLLRNKSVVQRAGAQVLNGLVGNIAIPKQTGAATAYWVAESGSPTESKQALGQVAMSPKTVGAYTDYSRKLLIQSSIDVESFVRNDLAQVLALEIDRAALYGSGASNQPMGLKAVLAAFNTASQELNQAGATPTFAEVVSLESKISSANADVMGMKYICNASQAGALKTAEKASGYPVYLLDGGKMNGYETLVSNQIETGDLWFGNWSDLMMGFWSGLDLMVDPYSLSTQGAVRIVALQDCDIAARHEVSFSRGNNTP